MGSVFEGRHNEGCEETEVEHGGQNETGLVALEKKRDITKCYISNAVQFLLVNYPQFILREVGVF